MIFSSFFYLFFEFSNFIYYLNFLKIFIYMMNFYFLSVVFIVFFSVYCFSFYYLKNNKDFIYFMVVLFLFVLSMMLLLMSNSILLLFLGWDGLGISSFILVNFYKNWNTLNNSLLTFMSNRFGDIFILMFFSFLIYKNFFNFYFLSFMLIMISITKSAQFPFMSWLPAAMAAPTPVSALVHSSTLVTAGVFILFYFKFYLNILNLKIIFLIGIFTTFSAGLSAILESDFKKMIAFSTLSQVGFLFIMISNFKFCLCFFHLFSHAFFKSMLFISVGSFLHSSNSSQESRSFLKNMFGSKPAYLILNLSILNLIGLLFSSGFWSKDLFLMFSFLNFHFFNKFFLILIIALTFIYSFKLLFFMKNFKFVMMKENSKMLLISIFFLMFLSLFFSLYFFENYLYFFENYLFFFENIVYLFFIVLFLGFNKFFLKLQFNNFFMKIIGLMNLNFLFMMMFNLSFMKMEKLFIDNNFFKMKNLFLTNKFFYFFILIMFLLIFF